MTLPETGYADIELSTGRVAIPLTRIAFFDLDDTITDVDTNRLWFYWKSGFDKRVFADIFYLLPMYRSYRIGELNMWSMQRYFKHRIGKHSADDFSELCQKFFNEQGVHHIHRDAILIINLLKRYGTRLVLITGQHDCIARPFAQYLGFDDCVGNSFEIKDGYYHEPVLPYTYYDGKIFWAEVFLKRWALRWSQSSFYSDSISDLPLLQNVGYPVAVNPDRKLKNESEARNWPCLILK